MNYAFNIDCYKLYLGGSDMYKVAQMCGMRALVGRERSPKRGYTCVKKNQRSALMHKLGGNIRIWGWNTLSPPGFSDVVSIALHCIGNTEQVCAIQPCSMFQALAPCPNKHTSRKTWSSFPDDICPVRV